MLWRRTVGLGAMALMALMASAAYADVHQVGNAFYDNNSNDARADVLALVTLDGATRIAAIMAEIHHLDAKQAADRLAIGFYDKGDWDKFVLLWNDAVHAKPPSEADAYKLDAKTPSYFDAGMHTMISVSRNTDGDIEFGLFGKPGADGKPTTIGSVRLPPSGVKSFDDDVNAISAYFTAK